jgi:predicted PurR-regulated permease PerM
MYALRAVLVPILVAFALAYVFDPAVKVLHKRLRFPRVVSALALLALFVAGLTAFSIWLMPKLLQQLSELSEQVPVYWDTLRQRLAELGGFPGTAESTADSALPSVEADSVVRGTVRGAGKLFGMLGTVFGTASYLAMAIVLVPILFVFFATYFDRLARLRQFLPMTRRERIWELLKKIDAAFSAYVRGQFVVALFTTTGFCIGFSLIGVPYWFVVSIIGGILSLIPYGQCSGWLLAILFKAAESLAGAEAFSWIGVLLAPTLVYLVTQSVETWVITPLVQGEAANLHPIVVLVALIIGGTVAGIIGLILAIPVTASARILFSELALPRIRRWAESH